ncbi:hypothetical protein M408DRAFT_243625 [Serendipita vermifera MAFF 305830]|uniref:Uncharacterized protein n=1 Tax=Serendipita vermifera MAFF 305830 TaxID=933852 RepID=A0A0C3AVX5_SERVB|nr:hypothetical protein M408DRAFT_243625 [Serendipita vermifera MAFF 305830]
MRFEWMLSTHFAIQLNVYQKVVVPEGPAITTPKYRIIVTKSDGTEIGYIRELLGSSGRLPTFTTDVSEAAIYEKEGPATNSELFDLRQISPQIADYPYFGAYTASDTWQWLANVKQTPEGATPQNIGSSFSSNNSVESRIWKKDLSTSQLNQIWVRGDGTSGPVYQTFYGNVNNPEAGGFLSSFIAGSFPAPNTPVNFYLDDVPQVETL